MKKKDNHIIDNPQPDSTRRLLLCIVIVISISLVAILTVVLLITKENLVEPKVVSSVIIQKEQAKDSSNTNLFNRIIKRTYAIDVLFHQVYTPEWEGAYGAIGDAHFYATTGDQNLLNLYTNINKLIDMHNGTWVDDRAWVCLAEMYWWDFSGRKNRIWIEDARTRYLEARREGRLSHHEGFWSWYNWPPGTKKKVNIFSNTNMNQMATVACWLYEATREQQFYIDAMLVWNGDRNSPGIEKKFYRGGGKWEGKEGLAAFGKQFAWEGAGMCSIGAAMYKMTGESKYKEIAVATAKRVMDPANGWIDSQDYYQLRMDGNGAFVHFILDAYQIAPDQLSDIPGKVEKMLDHVWTNHNGQAAVILHRLGDDGIRNGWNPYGGEDGYNVDEVGTVHAQGEAVRAFGVFAYVLYKQLNIKHE